ncbi:MAG: hypothetical protein K2M80_00190 [Muribaculaceae bacterium]|nr:hypothetical protein [Muribaculaceae bacterium]
MEKAVNLKLPAFAWLTDDELDGRDVLLHVRSATVLEFFSADTTLCLRPDVIQDRFTYRNRYGVEEPTIVAVHYAPLLDEREQIMEEVVEPAITYYKRDCDKMDEDDGQWRLN